ncbi:MAG TPA: chemotaxis response regulator protein-glutamate methylesterase [bacterium]|nr:chemotaxis response regulator protein-glutamate methylesterase [bacterium]HPN43965.1 chemotaxis response regulator protein-glutamate methylesterase [bacterium]
MTKKIKVLIVDDSAVVRQTLADILSSSPEIEVMDTAADPYIAVEKIADELPDVITLDIEMPRMDGLTFLEKIMTQHPLPVVIVSSLAYENSSMVFRAIELGAVDIITKPRVGTKQFLQESTVRICDTVIAASQAHLKRIAVAKHVPPKLSADVVLALPKHKEVIQTTEKVVLVGASTGGTEALRIFLQTLPHDTPGIVIVQHMPEHFTRAFADRLNSLCKISIKEAENNDSVIRGRALIAPGNYHTLLKRSGTRYYVEVREGPLVSRHRPSVDVLFRSGARYAGPNAIGVIMTGMGNDGTSGMVEMRDAGAFNIAQDENSCVVFGMPNEAIKAGAIHKVLPLENIAAFLLALSKNN